MELLHTITESGIIACIFFKLVMGLSKPWPWELSFKHWMYKRNSILQCNWNKNNQKVVSNLKVDAVLFNTLWYIAVEVLNRWIKKCSEKWTWQDPTIICYHTWHEMKYLFYLSLPQSWQEMCFVFLCLAQIYILNCTICNPQRICIKNTLYN